jgi:conjugative relaxase-like TrwC/TraI family protein
MGWMRMMGPESVEYHRATVLRRADDHPGMAMEYYSSRGETPLVWGGSGRAGLGLDGAVTAKSYEAVFGPGGAKDPRNGERLVQTRRPGMELVISAHKSVAELGVIGRAEDMHRIMDAERDATLAYLDRVTRQMGGRRGEAAKATETDGLIYAHTRHATSRAGDPCPHDHILLANLLEMKDGQGGWKAADTALWREQLHAATMVGRVAAARVAVELGYAIEPDPGPSGRLGHWKIAGVPDEVMDVHSKRAAEIEEECQHRGEGSYRARGVAARATRKAKRHEPEGQLVERWRAELASVGWPVERLAASVDAACQARQPAQPLSLSDARALISEVLADDGELARRKVFSRRHVVVAMAPHIYGQAPEVLDRLVDRALADPEVVPLVGVAGARETAHSLALVLARESAIAESLGRQLARRDGPAVPPEIVEASLARAVEELGAALSEEQRQAAIGICTSGRGAEIVVGVAGAGKTTMLRAVADAFERSGHQVLGTATSGQAAHNLAQEAGIGESRTLASLIWRLEHGQVSLTEKTAVVLDEVGMTDDVDLARLAAHVELAGAKLVLSGDHRQLSSVRWARAGPSVPW